jgi:hypothetical protein
MAKQRSDAGTERVLTKQEKAIKRGLKSLQRAIYHMGIASEHIYAADTVSPDTDNRRTVKKKAALVKRAVGK